MKRKLILIIILFIACVLRLGDLSGNPLGLTWDEVALGVNAKSIWETGRDEYGNFLPLNLKSFGDYKPALYAYLTAPIVGILGLTEFSIRLPSAILGILTVYLIFLLSKKLFGSENISLVVTFAIAVSPWHIQFSRPAFEANMALTLNILGLYLFLLGLEKKKFLIFSATVFGLSLLTYQASRFFVPLLIVSLLIIFRKKINYRNMLIPGVIFLFFISVVSLSFLNGQTNRLQTTNFFAYQRSVEQIQQISDEDELNKDSFIFRILHGEWFIYIRGLVERYLIYFSPKTLFIDGPYEQRHRVPDLGIAYYFSIITIPLGLIYLIKNWTSQSKLIFSWLLLSPLPAVFSRDLISILRALNMVLPMVIIEGLGFYYLGLFINKLEKNLRIIGFLILSLVISFNILIFLDRYFIHAPVEYSKYWLYGYREAFTELNQIKNKYQKIIITDVYGQPYIYYLFYSKIAPVDFQKKLILDQPGVDVGTVRRFDNIEFRHIYWPSDRNLKNTLFIGSPEELPDKDITTFKEFSILKRINFLNKEEAFKIIETK